MKILFLIGNGFDINLGLKTKYADFYEYYKTVDSPNDLITDLKTDISSNIENWSDLELAFGKHTTKLKDLNEFDKIYEDIVDNLCDYLEDQEARFEYNTTNVDEFFQHLIEPERFLSRGDQIEIKNYRNSWANYDWVINIITFN